MLRAILIYIFVGLYVAIMAPFGIIWSYISRNTDLLFSLARFCMRVAAWMGNVKVDVSGRDRIQPGQAYLFLSNHQGNFDGPVLFYATGRNLRAVVKQEMKKIPVLWAVLRRVDFVPIERSDPLKARAGIDRAAQLLRAGYSFFAFPEGTRSRDGQLGGFKKGVFVMALTAAVPIVPVSIRNSRAIQPPGRFSISPGTIQLTFHDPIPTEHLHLEDRDHLLQMTRAAIEQGLSA
jgi:1-acyl-sn-glycerol-3-phosphate acyltransferase